VNAGDRFIFWSDDVDNGTYGDFDTYDNFGVIKVNSVSGTEASRPLNSRNFPFKI